MTATDQYFSLSSVLRFTWNDIGCVNIIELLSFRTVIEFDVVLHNQFMRVTPPSFWYAIFRGNLDGTHYAKGRYAVRRNSVISYADINFYFKKVQFSLKKHNTHDIQSQITLKKFARSLRSRFFGLISAFIYFNMDFRIWGGQNLGYLTSKHIKPNAFKNYCTCAYNIL